MTTTTRSVWGRSERQGPFTGSLIARFERRLLSAAPWNAQGMGVSATPGESTESAAAYSFGPKGPTRRQLQEMQRRQEQARKMDKARMLVQAILVGVAAVLMYLWAQWMR